MEYKIGDKVICVENLEYPVRDGKLYGGLGWELGRVFTITTVCDSSQREGLQVVWGDDITIEYSSTKGIYSNYIKLYNPIEEIIEGIKKEIGINN